MAIAVTVTSAAVIVMITQSQTTDKYAQGDSAYDIAESGAEEALIRLLRNPNFSGETLTLDAGTATISATGTSSKTILSVGRAGNFLRQVQINATFSAQGQLSIISWSEKN